MATRTPIIDSQVHAYERDRPERPWVGHLVGPDEVTGDDMVAAMDAVGVDGALLVSPYTMYRFDPSYALEIYEKHPGRFGGNPYEPDHPGLNRILAAGAKAGFPVNVMCSGQLPLLRELARRHPDTQVVIDHLGTAQPFDPPPPPEPFADLANVLALAECDNVAIKISGTCTLSHEPFPYPDIWEPLGRVFDAFGFDRCLWGTDWTRAVNLLTYEQGVEAFRVTDRLSDSERSALMGGSLAKIYNWSPVISE